MAAPAMVRMHRDIEPVLVRNERPAFVLELGGSDKPAAVFRDQARFEVPRAVPGAVVVLRFVDRSPVVGIGGVRDLDVGRVVGRRERADAHCPTSAVARPAPSSSSEICSADSIILTVPKSWRWNGVTPSSRRALRWSIVG